MKVSCNGCLNSQKCYEGNRSCAEFIPENWKNCTFDGEWKEKEDQLHICSEASTCSVSPCIHNEPHKLGYTCGNICRVGFNEVKGCIPVKGE